MLSFPLCSAMCRKTGLMPWYTSRSVSRKPCVAGVMTLGALPAETTGQLEHLGNVSPCET
jgi:hypothetical protein